MFNPDEIVALLEGMQKMLEATIREAKANPAFAERLGAAMATGMAPDVLRQRLAPDAPNPMVVFLERGEGAFAAWLEGLDLETLRKIIRRHGLDRLGEMRGERDKARLAALIHRQITARYDETSTFLPGSPGATGEDA